MHLECAHCNNQQIDGLGLFWLIPSAISGAVKAGKSIARKKKRKKKSRATNVTPNVSAQLTPTQRVDFLRNTPKGIPFQYNKNKWILPAAIGGAALIGVILLTRK